MNMDLNLLAENQPHGTKDRADMQILLEKNNDALVLAIRALSCQLLEKKSTNITDITTDSAAKWPLLFR